jgi:phage gpG-like protein
MVAVFTSPGDSHISTEIKIMKVGSGSGSGATSGRLQLTFALPGVDALAVGVFSATGFQRDVSDFTRFWDGPFKTYWYATRKLDYASAGTTTGAGWAPLSPAYRAWKNRHYPSAPLLVQRGTLRASLTSPTEPGSVWEPAPTGLRVGTRVPYGMYHQMGTRRMPARPPLRLNGDDGQRIGKLLQEFVVTAWQARRLAARAS